MATAAFIDFPVETHVTSKGRLWTGRVLTTLPVAFLGLDAVVKFVKPAPVIEAFGKLGYPIETAITLGVVLLACTILYSIPRTANLGAVLLTGYLGGAISTHLRVGDPLFSHVLFPVYMGVMIWGGIYLRDARVRRFFGARS